MNSSFKDLQVEFSLAEEGAEQSLLTAGLSEGIGDSPAKMKKIVGNEVGKAAVLGVAPDVLGRIEVRRVGGMMAWFCLITLPVGGVMAAACAVACLTDVVVWVFRRK